MIAPPDTADEALAEAGRVIGSLPAGIAARVDTVEVSSVDKIQLVLGNGRRVLWGSAEDSGQKAEVLAVLLDGPASRSTSASRADPPLADGRCSEPRRSGAAEFSFLRGAPACCRGTPGPIHLP